jgi:hypothetical protein
MHLHRPKHGAKSMSLEESATEVVTYQKKEGKVLILAKLPHKKEDGKVLTTAKMLCQKRSPKAKRVG